MSEDKSKKVTTDRKTESTTKSIAETKVSRRSMLKWTTGLAAAGVIGLGVGYGTDELLRSTGVIPPQVTTMTETATETVKDIEEQVLSTTTIGGPLWGHVRDGRLAWLEPLSYTEKDAKPWSWTINGKTIKPPTKISISECTAALRMKIYSPDRPRYPMKRVGFVPGPQTASSVASRGKGEWVRISWEEAYSIVTSEMQRIKDKYGNSGISLY